jgi:MFS transporter, DHA1 family, inner membrane transport protein
MTAAPARRDPPPDVPRLTAAQWLLLLVLAAAQLTHIVDFMILMPLATYLQADLGIGTRAFGALVSAYSFAACLSGLLLAPWLDRFDRKPTLLALYAGFTAGTLLCAVAGDYRTLLAGRVIAGAFGGVVNAVVLAVVGDAFPVERRGTATGVVMSAFSVASIAGVPAGLLLASASALGWRAPFAALALGSAGVMALAWATMPPIAGHLDSAAGPARFRDVLSRPAHLPAFLLMWTLVFSGFTVIPYIAPFLEKNVGLTKAEIPLVYLVGGLATLVSMNVIGRLADRFPRRTVFRVFALLAVVPIVTLTLLPPGTPLVATLAVTTAMMVLTSGRMVPAMALITSTAEPRVRGSFLSVNSSVQQLGAGLAPLVAGFLMHDPGPGQPLAGYPLVGAIAATGGVATVFLIGLLHPAAVEPARIPVAEG